MKEELQIAPLPEDYDDDRSHLNILSTIQNALNDDLALSGEDSTPRIDGVRNDWVKKLWPSFEEAKATTVEALSDVHAQARLLDSLCARVKVLGGTSNTLNKRLDSMLAGLKKVGLAEEHRARLKDNLRRVKRASGFKEEKPHGHTMEEWGATARAADAIIKNPKAYSYNNVTPFSDRTAKMSKAYIWLTVAGAIRPNETLSIKVNEIDQNGFTYYISKNRNYPEEKYQPMSDGIWQEIEPYLKVRDSDDELLFPSSYDTHRKMAKVTMLEAGLNPHNGRLGVHGFRHLFATHSLENDYASMEERQHMLGHKTPETLKHYTRDSAIQAALERASVPWQDAVVEEVGCTFEWDKKLGEGYYHSMLKSEVPIVPTDALGPGRVVWDNQVLHFGKPVCFHDKHVMMPLIDENGETVQYGIVEIQGPNAMVGEPVRLIVNQRSIGWARPDLNRSPDVEQFFAGYRAALEDLKWNEGRSENQHRRETKNPTSDPRPDSEANIREEGSS